MILSTFYASRTDNTRRAYAQGLRDFTAYMGACDVISTVQQFISLGPGKANHRALMYQSELLQVGKAPSTVNLRIAALRMVVKAARLIGVINWALDVQDVPRIIYKNTAGPGLDGMIQLLSVAREQKRGKAERDYAILWLLFDPALRRAEVARLDVSDVDFEAGTVSILGKGRREKETWTLPDEAVQALRDWLDVRDHHPGPLFVNFDRAGKGERLTADAIHHLVKYLGQKMGIKTSPHALRHTGVTQAVIVTNGNLVESQKFSRHADPRTLMNYFDNLEDVAGRVAKLIGETVRNQMTSSR